MSVEYHSHSSGNHSDRKNFVYYPDGDGKPIAETGFHVLQLLHALVTLEFWFRDIANVYVSGNLLFYYQEGNPRRRVAPDVFVVWGVSKEMRRNYKLWEEKQAPQVVIEITSKETQKEDIYENEDLMREVRARRAAEAEVARLKAEIEKLRSQPETN